MPATERDSLATVPQVAEYLSISRAKLYQMMDSGSLPHVKLGHSRRILWSDVEQLVAESTIRGSSH